MVVTKALKHFDWKSTAIHISILLILYFCMGISENIDAIKDLVVNHLGIGTATVLTGILAVVVKKSIEAIIGYLSSKQS